MIGKRIVEIRCKECNFPLHSNDSDEIEQWKYLIEMNALKCPRCKGNMKFEKARGEINVEATIK